MDVQIATPEWSKGVYDLLTEMQKEVAYYPLDKIRALSRIMQACDGFESVCGVIGTPSQVEATLGLFEAENWYSAPKTHYCELWYYVGQSYRNSRHAQKLLKWAEKISYERGKPVTIGVWSPIKPDIKLRLMANTIGGDRFISRTHMFKVAA